MWWRRRKNTIISLFVVVILLPLAALTTKDLASSTFNWPLIVQDFGEFEVSTEDEETEEVVKVMESKSVYFLGDLMLSRDVERTIKRMGYVYPFANIKFSNDSYVVANFESAIPVTHAMTPNNTFKFSTDPALLSILKAAGVTHLSLANNHSFDFGLAGYNNAISKIWDNDMVPFGHPSKIASTSLVYIDDMAVVAIHTLYGRPGITEVETVVREAKSRAKLVVAYIHWGEEYVKIPPTSIKSYAEDISELGFNLIIGHHPHVVQSIEYIGDTLVFYSLGNFIFDQYFSRDVQEGLAIRLNTTDEGYGIELLPVTSVDTRAQPRYMEGESKSDFLNNLADISDTALSEQIRAGLITYKTGLASSTEVFIMAQ
jgi:gamma-polyglutamate biosynthesis protein CapA